MSQEGLSLQKSTESIDQEKIKEAQAVINYLKDKIFTEERMAEILTSPLDSNSSVRKVTEEDKKIAQLRRDIAGVYSTAIKKHEELIESYTKN